jgi:hypothetical protein
LGDHDPAVAETMASYANVLRALHLDAEAQQMEARLRTILNEQKGK